MHVYTTSSLRPIYCLSRCVLKSEIHVSLQTPKSTFDINPSASVRKDATTTSKESQYRRDATSRLEMFNYYVQDHYAPSNFGRFFDTADPESRSLEYDSYGSKVGARICSPNRYQSQAIKRPSLGRSTKTQGEELDHQCCRR